jgi:hypothetical protein
MPVLLWHLPLVIFFGSWDSWPTRCAPKDAAGITHTLLRGMWVSKEPNPLPDTLGLAD